VARTIAGSSLSLLARPGAPGVRDAVLVLLEGGVECVPRVDARLVGEREQAEQCVAEFVRLDVGVRRALPVAGRFVDVLREFADLALEVEQSVGGRGVQVVVREERGHAVLFVHRRTFDWGAIKPAAFGRLFATNSFSRERVGPHMDFLTALGFVFVAGLATDLATGLGALPFFFVDEVSERWRVGLWGLASGIMLSASGFGLVREGLNYGTPAEVAAGALVGVLLVLVAGELVDHHEFEPREIAQADLEKLVLIGGVLTVHSFPEGVAVGVSFADIGLEGGIPILGVSIPLLAVFMTIAISIHNVPEGLAVSIPLHEHGMRRWTLVKVAVFTSVPQPIGAVLAFAFVEVARVFLPLGFGFAAGAMIYLVGSEFIPEAIAAGRPLPNDGVPELAAGLVIGILGMTPMLFVA
jgi:ZIP family zinc transporter